MKGVEGRPMQKLLAKQLFWTARYHSHLNCLSKFYSDAAEVFNRVGVRLRAQNKLGTTPYTKP